MGVGYQVSPLHRLIRLDTTNLRRRAMLRGESPLFDAIADASGKAVQLAEGPLHTRSPTIESILVWRQRIASKYRDQLNEELIWDERSTYEASDDVATNGDLMLHFAAAVMDQRGPTGLGSMMSQIQPSSEEIKAAFADAERRGFAGRFPQLLLGARIWLPFSRNLMIEEPDWDGSVERYGSVPRLLDEITEIRAGIAAAHPSVEQLGEPDALEDSLTAAWRTSATVLRLVTLAAQRHLPLWTTG
jgi:hypothetical protein